MSERLIRAAFAFFLVTAALGAGFALAGPVEFMRLLGLVALACAAAGCGVQLYALRTFAPTAYAALRARVAAVLSREDAGEAMARA